MESSKEFQINELITLRLREGKTRIYVAGEEFIQCRYLFIVDPEKTLGEEVDSIDQAAAMLDNQLENEEVFKPEDVGISPEEMFWGHCSNLHAWVEYGYDSRLLHSNLAFPLLKELARIGDAHARKIFKEEVVKRFVNGTENTRHFLCEEGYLEDLNEEELGLIIDPYEAHLIKRIEKEINTTFSYTVRDVSRMGNVAIENGHVTELKIYGHMDHGHMDHIPEMIGNLPNLRYLRCSIFDLKRIPEWINNLTDLRELHLPQNNLEELIVLKLPKLVKLKLSYNKLTSVDFSGCELPNLSLLYLNDNQLAEIHGLLSITNLEVLCLWRNQLDSLPEELLDLPNLIGLDIKHGNTINIKTNEIIRKLKEKGLEIY